MDACRNNPFSAINKTAGRGLAIVDAPNGSIVSYSTAPGTEALDGDGQNSPYTTALMKIGHEPGLQIEQLLKRVRLDVSNTTARQQFPWESSSLTVEFSFFPSGSAQQAAAPATKSQPAATTKARSEARSVEAWQKELKSKNAREAYELVVREDQVEGYQAYLALYPSQSTASAVRSLSDRRQVMVAWYTAVTVNTVASYQAFLASYGTSDFAATADRLIDRARARSVSGGAAAAFASVSPTCPCSLPATPTLRQRRTDTTPTQTPTQNTGSNSGGGAPKVQFGGHRSGPGDHPDQSGTVSRCRPGSRSIRSRRAATTSRRTRPGTTSQNRPAVPTATNPNRAAAPTATIPVAPAGTTMIPRARA